MKSYSRLASVEQKKNIKRAYSYIFLSILAVVFLVLFGIPLLVKFAGFVGDIAKSDKPVEINDITPPAPPHFDDIPDFVNNESIEITGTAESGATVRIRANNNDYEITANNEGVFTFMFNLKKGENSIDAIAIDSANNKSTQTQTQKIIFDSEEPKIEILSPSNGDNFYGSSQKQLNLKGTVDGVAEITINDRFVALKDDNSFVFNTSLNEGSNEFKIKAVDPAGNETETSITVNFSF
jgi:hypothetical protein